MSRIRDIITRVRDTLADKDGDRWNDNLLLRLIDEAQKDLCRNAKLLRSKISIPIFNGIENIDLPDDVLLIDKILYDGKVIPLIPHHYLDERDPTWEQNTGKTIEAIVYDKNNRHKLRVYPIPTGVVDWQNIEMGIYWGKEEFLIDNLGEYASDDGITNINSDYGFVTEVQFLDFIKTDDTTECTLVELSETEINQDFGVVASINSDFYYGYTRDGAFGTIVDVEADSEYEFNQDIGFIVDFKSNDFKVIFDNEFGIVTDVSTDLYRLIIYYIKKPKTISSLDDELEIDSSFDIAIKNYVIGMALRNDMDAQNRQAGNEWLQLYQRDLQNALRDDFRDFVRTTSNKRYEIQYKGFL